MEVLEFDTKIIRIIKSDENNLKENLISYNKHNELKKFILYNNSWFIK